MRAQAAFAALSLAALIFFGFPLVSVAAGKAPAKTGFALVLDETGILPSEKATLERFLKEVKERVPPHLASALGRPIPIRFSKDLDRAPEIIPPPCPTDENNDGDAASPSSQIRGRTKKGKKAEIELHAGFKTIIFHGEQKAPTYTCGHRNLYRLALGTLLHELTHLYDLSDYRTEDQLEQIEACKRTLSEETIELSEKLRCERVLNGLAISTTDEFRELMDWKNTARPKPRNRLFVRSPDPYEFTSLQESFATNMEYFLLDAEFACRRPSVHEFLSERFGDPFPNRTCQVRTEIALSRDPLGGPRNAQPATADIDPERVYEIHHLFASRGPDLMSRWGHSMYRIVVCAPNRTEPGPECLSDIAHHVVVSYRANVGNWNISPWKGLSGGYLSQMFLYRFYPEIVNEYTIDEFRDLISLPLKLDESQKRRFIHRVLEQAHEYQGRYYFFTNNCASEALYFLKGVLRKPSTRDLWILTPLGLYRELHRRGIIDRRVLSDRAGAISGGYLFPSKKPDIEITYGKVRAALPELSGLSLEDFLGKTSAKERLAYFEMIKARDSDPRATAMRFFLLESHILRVERRAFFRHLISLLEKRASANSGSDADALFNQLVDALARAGNALPAHAPLSGYGIPQDGDFEDFADSPSVPVSGEESLMEQVFDWAKESEKKRALELEAIQANRDFFLRGSQGSR